MTEKQHRDIAHLMSCTKKGCLRCADNDKKTEETKEELASRRLRPGFKYV